MSGKRKRPEIPDKFRDHTGHILYGRKHGVYIDDDVYPLDFARCGTAANHRAHLRRGQTPCGACSAADAARPRRVRVPGEYGLAVAGTRGMKSWAS